MSNIKETLVEAQSIQGKRLHGIIRARETTEKRSGDRECEIYTAFRRSTGSRQGQEGWVVSICAEVSAHMAHQREQQGCWASHWAEVKSTASAYPTLSQAPRTRAC